MKLDVRGYKTEVIRHLGQWRGVDQVEHATPEWVDWFNTSRLFEYCGDVPPVELEQAHYRLFIEESGSGA